jgi:hypothetical protein
MSKKKKDVIEVPAEITVEGEAIKLQTNKKYLKQAEKLVRRMDKVLTDVHTLIGDADQLYSHVHTTEINEKDSFRFQETFEVLTAVQNTLYWLTDRMARKYVGKDIALLNDDRRKSLKK